ncbi:MAG TPA: NAD+ synthase, partial [Bryobacteraceae bacterium]|nr:NAD+ synthase [Bryobacteraceae bacterium]
MRVALAQTNSVVGDLAGNTDRMISYAREAETRGAEIIVFPELSITGYPPRDLVERQAFLEAAEAQLQRLATETAELRTAVLCGYTGRSASTNPGKRATNSAAVLHRGQILFRQDKMLLPTYDVFDEARYFAPAEHQDLLKLSDRKIAVAICEDAWNDRQYWEHRLYRRDPVEEMATAGASVILSINASPYHLGKRELRRGIFRAAAARHGAPVIYVNQVGGNDHLVFDGSSFAMDRHGNLIASAKSFSEDLVLADLENGTGDLNADFDDELEAVYQALVLGTRDYVRKCGFRKVIIGLSGGIDSSLTAVIAVDALGRENVAGVAMPGPFSSDHSLADARSMAEKLGIEFHISSINPQYQSFLSALKPVFAGLPHDVTEENLQSRLRGATLMAISNKTGALVLTTGNKSELAVGYCTLYGDMCGGLAVISDVPKTLVYDLSRVGNRRHDNAIPESV